MRIRYSTRVLLGLVAVLSVLLAIVCERAERQRKIVAQLIDLNGIVYFGTTSGSPMEDQFMAAKGDWLYHYWYGVKLITLQPTAETSSDEQVEMLTQLPSIHGLAIWPGSDSLYSDEMELNSGGGLTDVGATLIVTHLHHLDHFCVTSSRCSPSILADLKRVFADATYVHFQQSTDIDPTGATGFSFSN